MICKQCGLDRTDLEEMTITMCLDYIEAYVELNNPKKKRPRPARRATQADFDAF